MGIILGIILLIVAVCFAVGKSSAKDRLEQITSSSKQKIGELIQVLQQTKDALDGIGDDGAIKENVTVVGQPQCQSPLTSPIGGMPCLYYRYKITVITKVRYQETDDNGNTHWETRTEEDTLDEGSAAVATFMLSDDTGKIIVEPNQNDSFEGLVKTVDRSERNFQNNAMFRGNQLSLGRLSIDVGDLFAMDAYDAHDYRRIGSRNHMPMHPSHHLSQIMDRGGMPETIKYVEEVLGLDRRLTAVGTICDSMGDFRLRKHGDNPLILSTKSREDMIKETENSIQNRGLGFSICGVLGLIFLILGICGVF